MSSDVINDLYNLSAATLFNDRRIIYDTLRTPRAIITARSVRIISPPQELFARNYTTTEEECVVRMSRLLLMNWLAFYVSPTGCIFVDKQFPLIHADIDTWTFPSYDKLKLKFDRKGLAHLSSNEKGDQLLDYTVQPIKYDSIQVPDNSMAILTYGTFPDKLRVSAGASNESNLCMRDVKLNVTLSTVDDFMLPERNDNQEFMPDTGSSRKLNAIRPSEIDNYMDFLRST